MNEIGRSDFWFEASGPHSCPGGARWLENHCLHAKATSGSRTTCCKALVSPGAPRSQCMRTTKAQMDTTGAFSPYGPNLLRGVEEMKRHSCFGADLPLVSDRHRLCAYARYASGRCAELGATPTGGLPPQRQPDGLYELWPTASTPAVRVLVSYLVLAPWIRVGRCRGVAACGAQ